MLSRMPTMTLARRLPCRLCPLSAREFFEMPPDFITEVLNPPVAEGLQANRDLQRAPATPRR